MRKKLCATLASAIFVMLAVNPAASQSFDERWSIVPKAHAEPAPESEPLKDAEPEPSVETNTDVRAQTVQPRRTFQGRASYYAYQGGRTASGEMFDRNALTAAHRSLPFGTRVRVTDPSTGNSVTVVITDRGPRKRDRVIDLSLRAAQDLGMTDRGVVHVRAEVL
jgi:rare lipoprotein A